MSIDEKIKEIEDEAFSSEKQKDGFVCRIVRATTRNRSKFENNIFIRVVKYPLGHEYNRVSSKKVEVLKEIKVNTYRNNPEYIASLLDTIRFFNTID